MGKRILGYCTRCNRHRWVAVEQGLSGAPATADRDGTCQEIVAYTSERSLDIETVERILKSTATESRKREIAAQLAEGGLTPDEVVRPLDARGARDARAARSRPG